MLFGYDLPDHGFQTDALRIAAGKDYLAAMLKPQHDAHVRTFRAFVRAYKNAEGYHLAMAEKARSVARMMLTADGREFIARRNAAAAEWRASRAGLPF